MKLFFERWFGGIKSENDHQSGEHRVNHAPAVTEHLTLYYSPSCFYCVRVQRAMERLRLTINGRDIQRDEGARMQLLTGGGRSTVPCLRIDSNGVISWMYESADIIRYLKGVAELAYAD